MKFVKFFVVANLILPLTSAQAGEMKSAVHSEVGASSITYGYLKFGNGDPICVKEQNGQPISTQAYPKSLCAIASNFDSYCADVPQEIRGDLDFDSMDAQEQLLLDELKLQ